MIVLRLKSSTAEQLKRAPSEKLRRRSFATWMRPRAMAEYRAAEEAQKKGTGKCAGAKPP
jgi:hypothetical protein